MFSTRLSIFAGNYKPHIEHSEIPPKSLIQHLRGKGACKSGNFKGIDYKYIGMGREAFVYKIGKFPNATALKIYHPDRQIQAQKEIENLQKLVNEQATKDVVEIYHADSKQGYLHREYISKNKNNKEYKKQNIEGRSGKSTLTEANFEIEDDAHYNRVQGILIDLGATLKKVTSKLLS